MAGTKLIQIRTMIEKNRKFVLELSTVFHITKLAAEKQKISLLRKKTGVANVVITSNHRFYGGLENRLINFFTAHALLSHGDNFIIGRTADSLLKSSQFDEKYKSFIFKQDVPTSDELDNLAADLLSYDKVLIYHTKMQSILVQRPVITEVGGLASITSEVDPRSAYYIFEPEIKGIVSFFDNQITKILLEQAFLEAELARTAARLVSMEQAQNNADAGIREQQKVLVRAQSNLANVRMLEVVLGLVGRRTHETR